MLGVNLVKVLSDVGIESTVFYTNYSAFLIGLKQNIRYSCWFSERTTPPWQGSGSSEEADKGCLCGLWHDW